MSTNHRYIFSGVIHPERAAINLPSIPMDINAADANISGKIVVTISASQLTAIFESDTEVTDFATLKNYIADVVRTIVDVYGYLSGCGYDVEIVKLILPGSAQPMIFGVDIPVLRPSNPDISGPFNQMINLFQDTRGLYVQRCLADLREAIRSPKDTAFFCYRAIEALRQYFVIEEKITGDKADSWERLRSALGVERDIIDYIKGFSDPLRHGADKSISDAERADIFKKTQFIINRFVDFASNNYADKNEDA